MAEPIWATNQPHCGSTLRQQTHLLLHEDSALPITNVSPCKQSLLLPRMLCFPSQRGRLQMCFLLHSIQSFNSRLDCIHQPQ